MENRANAEHKKGNNDEDAADDDDLVDAVDNADDDDAVDKPGFRPGTFQIVLTDRSLASRRKYVRGTCSIKQTVHATIVSHKKVCLPERPRRHYPGTNSGDVRVWVLGFRS